MGIAVRRRGKLTNDEMIQIVGELCGTNSVSFMNIRMYRGVDERNLRVLYEAILEREKGCVQVAIANKQREIQQLQGKLKEIEKLL